MQFETKIVNGKPSIFFSNDTSKTGFTKKINTKDKRATKAIRESFEISGEVDHVKPSPRTVPKPTNETQTQTTKSSNNKKSLNNNGLTLKPDQLMSLLTAIQTNGAQIKIDDNGRIKLVEEKTKSNKKSNSDDDLRKPKNDYYDNGYDSDSSPRRVQKQKSSKKIDRLNFDNNDYDDMDDVTTIRKPKIVTAYDSDEERKADESKKKQLNITKDKENALPSGGASLSLMEKKKLKWSADKKSQETLLQQEIYDKQKFNQNISKTNEHNSRMSVIPRSGHTPEPLRSDLTLAQKKRLQWQKEKEELNNSYRQNKSRFRTYYDEFNLRSSRDDTSIGTTSNIMQKSLSLNNLTQQQQQQQMNDNEQILSNLNIDNDNQKLSLMEKKKLKWANDKNDEANVWNPFGRPGGGAPNASNIQIEQPQQQQQQQYTNTNLKSNNKKNEELLKKQMELLADRSTSFHDQSKVPAAMRTSLLFGDVLFDDDIKKTKELERKKWLLELEAQKKEKIIEKEYNRERDKINDLKKDMEIRQQNYTEDEKSDRQTKYQQQQQHQEPEQKSFQRSLNRLLDPSQIEELERKRKANLQHQKEIQAQIQEKQRIKKLEDELQQLNNQKIENEAKLINIAQQQELSKRKQQYFSNESAEIPKTPINNNNNNNNDEEAVDGAQLQLLQAEYNAALEKHRRLLVKLQRGGHDTEKLENKFNEFRNKCRAMGVNVGNDPPTNIKQVTNSKKQKNNEIPPKAPVRQQQYHNDHELDRKSRLKDESINTDESSMIKEFGTQTDQSKLKQIFNLLREDTNDMPIELTEENVKLLLKKVAKNPDLLNNNKQQKDNKFSTRTIEKPKQQQQAIEKDDQNKKKRLGLNERPKWGYKNLENKKSLPNSHKDPFFKERQAIAEERRQLQLEQLKALVELNNKKTTQSNRKQNVIERDDDHHMDIDADELDVRKQQKTHQRSQSTKHQNQQPQQESIMNLLNNHNLRNKPIYEEDDDDDGDDNSYNRNNRNNNKTNTQRRLKTRQQDDGKNSNMGFVPFMRTDEFLDPAHATSPVPPSRESTATKRDREKARQAYFQNMKPSDYGSTLDNYHENKLDIDYRNKMKDPLFNKNLVKGRPTPRQEHILSQLANLKQTLMQKQKEVASSIRYDDDDDDDNLNLDD